MSSLCPAVRELTLAQEFRLLHHRYTQSHPRVATFSYEQLIHDLLLPMLAGIGAEKWEEQALIITHGEAQLPALLLNESVYVLMGEGVAVISALQQSFEPTSDRLLQEAVLDLLRRENGLYTTARALS